MMPPIPSTTIATLLLLVAATIAARQRDVTWLLDAAFVLLYARYPLPATLVLVGVQAIVRRVPTLARECAVLLRVEEPAGWTLHALLFALPGLNAYAAKPVATLAPPAPAVGATVALDPIDLPPMTAREWLAWANDDETAPHLGVIGPTRAGKTTLVLAALGRRKGDLVIATPKSKETDPWGSFPAVRMHFDLDTQSADFAPLADVVRQAHREMLRRNAESTIGQEDWLTVVLDEYSTLVSKRPEVRQWVIDLWTMGASAKIRVVVVAPEVNVRAWGIEGRGDVRENLIFARVAPDRTAQLFRIDGQGKPIAPRRIDTRSVKQLADQAVLSFRSWPRLSVWTPAGGGSLSPVVAKVPVVQTADRQTHAADDDLLAFLAGRGFKREAARQWLAARGMGLDNNRWAAVAGRHKGAGVAPDQTV